MASKDEQPVVGEKALARYARRFLYIWGALSVVMFIIAGALTSILVRVQESEPPYNPIGMYGEYHGNAVGWIYYYDTKRLPNAYLVYYPAGTKLVALPYGTLSGCSNDRPISYTIPARDVTVAQYQLHKYYLIALSKLPSGAPRDGKATCKIAFEPTRDSFVGYAMDYWFLPSLPNGMTPASTLNFAAAIDGADNMQVFGAQSTSSSGVALQPDDETVFKYTDEHRESLRDILLVAIGGLVALGTAMALESIRPFVELIAAGKH